ncbi:MAG: zinc-binding dehydrogenase [SAR202 cluster bacterium]|nr:zinc-binding dehydrogenase [SAR202 cluster bacterium]
MRAALVEAANQPPVVRTIPTPTIAAGDALVKMHACGICFTDLRIMSGGIFRSFPIVLGHEPVGIVQEVGRGVSGVRPGDRVGVHALFTCGTCSYCVEDQEESCDTRQLAGGAVYGGYAEYMRAPADHLIPLPAGLSFAEAAPFFCAGLTVYAGMKNGGLRPGHRIAVIGIGGLGHMAIPIARALGAEVVAVTSSPDKAETARALGAQHVTSGKQVGDDLRDLGGVHVALDTSGSWSAVQSVLPGLRMQSALVLLAGTGQGTEPPVPTSMIGGKQMRVQGSFYGSRTDVRELLALAEGHHIRPLVERFPLEQVAQAQEKVRSNQVRFRAVLTL